MNKIILMFAAIFAVIVIISAPVHATQQQFSITICHHTPGNDVTHTFQNLQSYLGHLGTPHSGSTYDTAGACNSPTPLPSVTSSPTASPTATPSPTVEPSETPVPTIDPCLEGTTLKLEFEVPCQSSEPSATPGVGTTDQYQPNNDPAPVVCAEIKETPAITEVSRNNSTSIHAKWTAADSFVEDYKIEYGLATGIPLWNTIVHGTETNLNYLPFNHVLWLRVAATHQGCLGNYSGWIDP